MANLRMKAVRRSSAEMNQVIAGILLRNDVPDWEYSFGRFREQCQCLVQERDLWQVCFVERGKKRGCAEFQTQKEAARELLSRLGRTEELREKMLTELEKEWKPLKVVASLNPPSCTLERVAADRRVAAHIFDRNGTLIATVKPTDVDEKAAQEQVQKMQTELLKERIQEMNTKMKAGEAAAVKPVHKSLSRLGTKKSFRYKAEEKKKMDLRRDLPDMGWKG